MAEKLIVGNGTLVTFGRECRLIENGALLLRDGLIAEIGQTETLRADSPDIEFVDAHGQYIMPGMICTHTHTYGAFARGMALKAPPPADFLQILQRLWWQLDRALLPDDISYSALVCLVDAIRHGTTTLFDHHASPNACDGSLDIIAQTFQQAGVRGCLCYEVSDREGKEKAKAGIWENERFIRSVRPSPPSPLPTSGEGGSALAVPLLSAMMGLHAAFTLSDETINEAAGIARDAGVGCHIHVAEGDADAKDSLQYHHAHTVARLHSLRVLGPRSIAAHCIHVDDQELAILAKTDTLVVQNPRSNMNNAVGTARVAEMLEQRTCVGLGNDGFSNDMFLEMQAAYLVHKAVQGDPQAMPADAVIETQRGHDLGRVIWQGAAAPNTGVPGMIGGEAAKRLLRAPVEGLFRSVRQIGDRVTAGEVVGYVNASAVTSNIDGVLRGIIHDGVAVPAGLKIGDVDPRAVVEQCFTISDKARAIGGGVLEALLHLLVLP